VVRELDLTIVYEPGEDGWIIASIPEVAGVFSQGRTREEARETVLDALKLMLSPVLHAADDRREREPLHLMSLHEAARSRAPLRARPRTVWQPTPDLAASSSARGRYSCRRSKSPALGQA
jgi:predicted RNase H-like HicB family nuclease